jgi:hypothetical protein
MTINIWSIAKLISATAAPGYYIASDGRRKWIFDFFALGRLLITTSHRVSFVPTATIFAKPAIRILKAILKYNDAS